MHQDMKIFNLKVTDEQAEEETEAQVQATAEAGQAIEKEEAEDKTAEAEASCNITKVQADNDRIDVLLQCLLFVNLHVKMM